jgi:hypothetical protein
MVPGVGIEPTTRGFSILGLADYSNSWRYISVAKMLAAKEIFSVQREFPYIGD